MIKINFHNGLACPFFVCDVCRKPITVPTMAMVAWGEARGGDGESITPAHVHKGSCLDVFEPSLPVGHQLMTDELTDHMAFLLDNSGFNAAPCLKSGIYPLKTIRD